ncbi:MAG: lipopolysaccharide biosynthesis protein [Bacteroidaceae bacterium]|nr:lipopolysaccharide biosynthesis protein [Bacteroidaceae bacterium]
MSDSIFYKIRSGKNSKLLYFTRNYLRQLVPRPFYTHRLQQVLRAVEERPDKAYIYSRANYYCRLPIGTPLPPEADGIGKLRLGSQKVYYFDAQEVLRWFPPALRWAYLPGDVDFIPDSPAVSKSRPIASDGRNANATILKLDKVRHFIFLRDGKAFSEKADKAVFLGKVNGKAARQDFLRKYFGHPRVVAGCVDSDPSIPPEWMCPKMTLYSHFDYKFILALEGNDVASNLKWVMWSNSLAVMPRPTCETWFMEGRLIPNVHYVEIRPDFSDLVERMDYYTSHPDEAQAIINNAHRYCAQFMDKKRETLIGLLTMQRYFAATGQLPVEPWMLQRV